MAEVLTRWSSAQRQTGAGAVESAQRAVVTSPVVEETDEGARRLGALYWSTVERSTLHLVQVRPAGESLELRLLGCGPLLLRFREPESTVVDGSVECRYPIAGGFLARYPAGAITLAQQKVDGVEVSSVISGFFPRLAAKPGRPHWTGALYAQVQSRIHVAISRRYFEDLARRVPMRVAVFGATGVIGTALVPALVDCGHDVVGISRREPGAGANAQISWARADATDAAAVGAALEGVDIVYYLVHSLGSKDFESRDLDAAAVVAGEAEAASVKQIVYLGGFGDDDPDLSPHLRSRRATGKVLGYGAVPVTTLRAAMVVGAGSAAFESILALVDRLPGMICPRWVGTPTQPIALADMIRYLTGVCGLDAAIGETLDAGGPEVMTYRQMIERIARLRGKHPLIIEVPVLSPRLSSYWLNLVTPVQASVARPLIEGLRNPTVASDDRLRELVPFELTSFDDAARLALEGR